MKKIRVGIVSFTDPRTVKGKKETDRKNIKSQKKLAAFLRDRGLDCFEPLPDRGVDGISSAREASRELLSKEADAVVFGCWKWTDPMLAVDVARRVGAPLLLFGEDDEKSTAMGCIAAVGAALWEIAPNEAAVRHERLIGDYEKAYRWAMGAGSVSMLRRTSLLLWGGSYCLKMPHLEDDPSALKRFLVGDILIEDEYHLVHGAEEILGKKKSRVEKFIRWLEKSGVSIEYDGGRFRKEILERQAALYLAARDRLESLDENIGGVSVRCQPALSELYGVTGCIIPSFMPYPEDSEGGREIVPAVCEGDIKGLITSVLLSDIAGGCPPGFGDIRHIRDGGKTYLIISNCGGASVYYAAAKGKKGGALGGVYMRPQCQGAAGCAVGYMGKAFGTATIARLIRRGGGYFMQCAAGAAVGVDRAIIDRLGWGDIWPVSMFDINMDMEKFTSAMGSNHYSFIPGDVTAELEYACGAAGIPVEYLNR